MSPFKLILALRLLKDQNEAEDIVQDTFLKVITKIDAFRGQSKLGTWLYRIAYNASLDRMRQKPESSLLEDESEDSDEYFIPMPES